MRTNADGSAVVESNLGMRKPAVHFASRRTVDVIPMTATGGRSNVLKNASTVTTLIDAMLEFSNGRRRGGLLLVGAAALSSRIPGLGTVASLLLRGYRRFV